MPAVDEMLWTAGIALLVALLAIALANNIDYIGNLVGESGGIFGFLK
ncbi:MAG: hypothetical protein ACPHN3_05215 [Spongiibacter sp.]